MQKLYSSIFIDAPVEKVWNTMLDIETYREWTKIFNPSSSYEGSWEEGAEIRFVGTDSEGGALGGMYARIKENRPLEFISIEHLGMIEDGVVDTTSEKVKKWAPAYENYTFTQKNGGTEVSIDMDVEDEYETMFRDMWPKALQTLKELCEK